MERISLTYGTREYIENALMSALRIRIDFNADPDPAFHLKADPDPDPGRQINVDPYGSESGSWSDFVITKCLIFRE
jgi:hypothetical protein